MPVLSLTAAPLTGRGAEEDALGRLRHAVAGALGLPDDGVVVTLVHSAPAAAEAWPLLVGYGRPRATQAMAAALDAARAVVAEAWSTTPDAVWAQWCPDVTGPPA